MGIFLFFGQNCTDYKSLATVPSLRREICWRILEEKNHSNTLYCDRPLFCTVHLVTTSDSLSLTENCYAPLLF